MLRIPLFVIAGVLGAIALLTGLLRVASFHYAYIPKPDKVANPPSVASATIRLAAAGVTNSGPPVDKAVVSLPEIPQEWTFSLHSP